MTADSSASSVREEIERIEAALPPYVNGERANHEKRYLKSPLDLMGVGVPATRRAVKGVVGYSGNASANRSAT